MSMRIKRAKELIKKRIVELDEEIKGYEYILEALDDLELEDELADKRRIGGENEI